MGMFYLAQESRATGEVQGNLVWEDRDTQRIEQLLSTHWNNEEALASLIKRGNVKSLGTDLDATTFQSNQVCSPSLRFYDRYALFNRLHHEGLPGVDRCYLRRATGAWLVYDLVNNRIITLEESVAEHETYRHDAESAA